MPSPSVAFGVTPLPLLPWLLGQGLNAGRPVPAEIEQRALRVIDELLVRPGAPTDLMPRARAVIPQLMAMLRRDDLALGALAQQVGRDLVLTAEVLRMARNAAYGGRDERLDLPQALGRLGVVGLNTAIAHVVLRPLFETSGDGLFARTGTRLWEHSESKAQHCSALACADGISAFEGYLAGLMHNSGWTVALRELDRSGLFLPAAESAPPPHQHVSLPVPALSEAFSTALQLRCDALFGKVAATWRITPTLTAVAESAASPGGLAASALPLAGLLRRADVLASSEVAGIQCPEPAAAAV
ncbi:HDOD domain-containing protein [Methylibium sp.]|uniref:HDOD domain-containing protein n=1 Tax=Methylibium sp. TaxID=2067992 RepID=UPI003D10CF58